MTPDVNDRANQLKLELEQLGYFTQNLWTVNDVMDRYHCTPEQAQDILYSSLTNEETMSQIQFSIREFAEMEGLEEIEEEEEEDEN